ncbi:MAG TPA: MFS transporter [Thermoleophilaceae bacterium]|jgi:EmrB/QacA subfamily drug resistance transporter
MSERRQRAAVLGLMLGTLVAVLSSTVVATALHVIVTDLAGTQADYAWVITAALVTVTVSTPVWGKLADLVDRKVLLQAGLAIYAGASLAAGISGSTGELIAWRAVQGVGVGGLTGLVQVVLSDLVPPRELGRYSGYLGGVLAAGSVSGPLLGGAIAETLGWRWCFFLGVPIAVGVSAIVHRTLRLPRRRREVHIDVPGALLFCGGMTTLLIWVSLGGRAYPWASWQTAALVLSGVLLSVAAILVERVAREPLIPLRLFQNRTVVIASVASVAVGTALFAASVFVPQYMQLARAKSPTESALLTMPLFAGLVIAAAVAGRTIVRTGLYKRWLVAGAALLTAGAALMGSLDETTSLPFVGACLLALGAGIGMLMHSLTVVTQNAVGRRDVGAGTSLVAFFRGIGGAFGVTVLSALFAGRAGAGTGHVFLAVAPIALAALVALALMRPVPLRLRIDD